MQFSVKTLFFFLTWTAWVAGASASGNPLLVGSFFVSQYLLMAASIAVALTSVGSRRVFAIAYAMGFFSWILVVDSCCGFYF